jgi:hypothetical protein
MCINNRQAVAYVDGDSLQGVFVKLTTVLFMLCTEGHCCCFLDARASITFVGIALLKLFIMLGLQSGQMYCNQEFLSAF